MHETLKQADLNTLFYYGQIGKFFILLQLTLVASSCPLLITFANNLDPDKAQHFVQPDLHLTCFTLMMVYQKEFFETL